MRAYLAVTDSTWFRFLSQRAARPPDADASGLDEVNFWQPSPNVSFKALTPGQPLLFKLHHPENAIAGGGFFAHFSVLPASLAWNAFGDMNGAATFPEMRARIAHYRRQPVDPREDPFIGCILLEQPFFLPRDLWLPAPADFQKNIVRGKGYPLDTAPGKQLWEQVLLARAAALPPPDRARESTDPPIYGDPILVRQRLGQGSFRVLVTDNYQRRCAITGERALPVLEAAHIRPVSEGGRHRPENGLLLRSDVHTLFDRGYVTVTPQLDFRVSRRLKADFDNGEFYYQLQGKPIRLPESAADRPDPRALEWHGDVKFLG